MDLDIDELSTEIEALVATLGEDMVIARPAEERAVLEKIRQLLEQTRAERTSAAQARWEAYLPYAARRCYQLTRVEAGWEDELEYFASENAQFWLDCASAALERGALDDTRKALARIAEAARLIKRDRISQVDLLLQALDIALEVSDRQRAIQLYEEAEKIYRKNLLGGADYTGSAWLPKIKKLGRQLAQFQAKLRRYYQYAASVTVAISADADGDLERVLDYLQQSLPGKVKITRRVKETDAQEKPGTERFRARIKITLE